MSIQVKIQANSTVSIQIRIQANSAVSVQVKMYHVHKQVRIQEVGHFSDGALQLSLIVCAVLQLVCSAAMHPEPVAMSC